MYFFFGLVFFLGVWILCLEVLGKSMEIGVVYVLNFLIVLEFLFEVLGIVILLDFVFFVFLWVFVCFDLFFILELCEFIFDLDLVEYGFGFLLFDVGEYLYLFFMMYL